MPRVAHFEIYTDNPEAVQSFYREIFAPPSGSFKVVIGVRGLCLDPSAW